MEVMMKISKTDQKILIAMQKSPTLSQSELADELGMSRTSCWRHVKDLEDEEILQERKAEINAEKIGLSIRANCVISINNHSNETRAKFEKHIISMDNVLECYATSGGKDYMLTVVARDIKDYYEMMSSTILDNPTIESSQTSFLMKKIKSTHILPIS